MKKKALSLLLALVMCLGLATSAMAESSTGYWSDTDTITVDFIEHREVVVVVGHVTYGEYAYWEPSLQVWMLNPNNLTFSTAGKASDYTVEYFVRGDTPVLGDNGNYMYDGKGNVKLSELNGSFANLEKLAGSSMDKILMFVCDSDNFDESLGWWMAAGTVAGIDANTRKLGIYTVEGSSKPSFADVAKDAYYADPVSWAVEKGITDGTGENTFSPNATCTQGQILTFLWRAKGEPAPTGTVSGSEYYATAAQWAKEQGLTDNFSANADCTRAMVVTYLWRLAGKPSATPAGFKDVPADLTTAVGWAAEQNITSGTSDTTFSPNDTCTRGQIVTFLYRAYSDK